MSNKYKDTKYKNTIIIPTYTVIDNGLFINMKLRYVVYYVTCNTI